MIWLLCCVPFSEFLCQSATTLAPNTDFDTVANNAGRYRFEEATGGGFVANQCAAVGDSAGSNDTKISFDELIFERMISFLDEREEIDASFTLVTKTGVPFTGITSRYLCDNTLKLEAEWFQGKRHGTQSRYYLDGTLQEETFWERGIELWEEKKTYGVKNEFYESGSIRETYPYYTTVEIVDDGYGGEDIWLNGTKTSYYESGGIMSIDYWEEQPDGIESRGFYESGVIKWENPGRDGVKREYYESGSIHWEEPYESGFPEGITKVYDENGVLRKIWMNERGLVFEECCFDALGEESLVRRWDINIKGFENFQLPKE